MLLMAIPNKKKGSFHNRFGRPIDTHGLWVISIENGGKNEMRGVEAFNFTTIFSHEVGSWHDTRANLSSESSRK